MPSPNVIAESVDLGALGAKPLHVDPTFDNAPVFNRLLDRLGRGVFCSIPLRGRYRHDDSLCTQPRMGAAFEGTAGSFSGAEASYTSTGQGGAVCGFVYCGPPDRPMFRLKGAHVRFTGVHFQGCSANLHDTLIKTPKDKLAPIGLHVEPNQNSLATGYVHLDCCSFSMLQTAIQCGDDNPTAHNAEAITGTCVRTSYVGTFLKVKNNQSVAHNIQQLSLWNTEIGIDLERGGGLTLGSCEVVDKWKAPCILLQTDKVDVNTGRVTLGDVKLDNTADGCQVLNMKSSAPLHLTLGLHVGNTIKSAPLFTIRGPARVRLNEVMGLPAKAFCLIEETGKPRPGVIVDGGTFRKGLSSGALAHPSSSGAYRLLTWDLNEGVG